MTPLNVFFVQNGFPTSPVYMQRFPSFQQGQEYQNFQGDRQPVYGNAQSFQYAQGGVYQDPNQFMGTTLGWCTALIRCSGAIVA